MMYTVQKYLHDRVSQYARQEDGSYRYDVIFDDLEEEIEGADLAIVNQEVIIAGEEFGVSGYPCFNAPLEMGDALVGAGFDVVCHWGLMRRLWSRMRFTYLSRMESRWRC